MYLDMSNDSVQILEEQFYPVEDLALAMASILGEAFHQYTSESFCSEYLDRIHNNVLKDYLAQYFHALNCRLHSYFDLCTAISNKRMNDLDFLQLAGIRFDSVGNIYGEDFLRLVVGIRSSLHLLFNMMKLGKNEDQALKMLQMTDGSIPTVDLVYQESSIGDKVGCIPLSKKQKLMQENKMNEQMLKYGSYIVRTKKRV